MTLKKSVFAWALSFCAVVSSACGGGDLSHKLAKEFIEKSIGPKKYRAHGGVWDTTFFCNTPMSGLEFVKAPIEITGIGPGLVESQKVVLFKFSNGGRVGTGQAQFNRLDTGWHLESAHLTHLTGC
jgi:hypothetical protein